MNKLEEKLINSYTILVMAGEVILEEVPETILSTGNTLRYEVELEEARRITEIVPEPVDYDILGRINELEETIEILEETTIMQDMVLEEVLFDVIPTILEVLGGE